MHATGIGTVPLISQISGTTYEVILSNVLLIPDFWLSLISIKCLASTHLFTTFPANSDTCYVQKDWNTILITKHKNGLYHAKVTPHNQQKAAHATVDINLLHQLMDHIFVNQIQGMVKSGLLQGIDTLTGTPTFCEACTLGR